MCTRPRPSSANLEFLRKEAKRLLKACRVGDASAIARVRAALPRLASLEPDQVRTDITLADVHQGIAREHGCASWAALIRAGDPLERLLVAVRGGALSFMLDLGVPAGGSGAGGVTALHVAAWHGHVEAVRKLLDHGAAVSARSRRTTERRSTGRSTVRHMAGPQTMTIAK